MAPLIEISTRFPYPKKEFGVKVPLVSKQHETPYGNVSLEYVHHRHGKSIAVYVSGLDNIPTTRVNISYSKCVGKANFRTDKAMKITLSDEEIRILK